MKNNKEFDIALLYKIFIKPLEFMDTYGYGAPGHTLLDNTSMIQEFKKKFRKK